MVWSESGKDSFARTIGDRVRELRIRRGYRSARELAEAIPNARLTAKVINNVEIGRKLDLTVVELLELSRALDAAPQLLLVDYLRPYDRTEIPGVSEGIATMSGVEFLEWLSLPFEGHPILMNLKVGDPEETGALLALRGYEMQRRFTEHQLQQLKHAVRINGQFPGSNDLSLLRRRAAEAASELRRMADFLRAHGFQLPDDHLDHELTTTAYADSDSSDHVDHTDHRNSTPVSTATPRT
ncbi:helix-turn-helix domain-containing protein [Microbacterium sp. GXF6406]|jgi:transcriptional regulator with XRE-family HTH domain